MTTNNKNIREEQWYQQHQAWLDRYEYEHDDYPGGTKPERANYIDDIDLSSQDLRYIFLQFTNLRDVSFKGANLTGANLVGTDLIGCDFSGAILSNTDLSASTVDDSNFQDADLTDAILYTNNNRCIHAVGCDFSRAKLIHVHLEKGDISSSIFKDAILEDIILEHMEMCECDFTGASLSLRKRYDNKPNIIPKIDNLFSKIQTASETKGCLLDMSIWHSCETAHCLAGWAIHLAGENGYKLQDAYGPATAGALIFATSVGFVPDFYLGDDTAKELVNREAAKEREAAVQKECEAIQTEEENT